MYIARVYLKDFRNLIEQEVSLSSGVNLILGSNGQGKTNFLEALYLLSVTKPLRAKNSSELLRWGETSGSVFLTLHREGSVIELSVSLDENGKKFFKNNTPVKSQEIITTLQVVTFIPADLEIIKGSPSLRRKFLDKCIVDIYPELLSVYAQYQRALEHKGKILKSDGVSPETLSPWNKILSEAGAKIKNARAEVLTLLQHESGVELELLKIPEREIRLGLETELGVTQEEIFIQLQQKSRKEIQYRSPQIGIQRDDVSILLGGVDARAFASQGQTRSAVIALKLGALRLIEKRRGEAPIVLLDDVDSELDSDRRSHLLERVEQGDRQVVITGTGGDHFYKLSTAKRFFMSQGRLTENAV